MKKGMNIFLVVFSVIALVSCKKDDASENCSICEGPNVQTFDVCEENGKIFVDGTEISELEGISLSRVIRELEANEDNDETFRDLNCN